MSDSIIPVLLKYEAAGQYLDWNALEEYGNVKYGFCENQNLYSLYLYLHLLILVTVMQLIISENGSPWGVGTVLFPNGWAELSAPPRLEADQG